MTPDFLFAGGIIIDNVVAADGAVHRRLMGGNAIHAAIGARLWAPAVGVIGLVPANYPQALLDTLATVIDVAGIRRVADETVDESEWFFYRPDGSRADRLHARDADFAAFGLAEPRLTLEQRDRWEAALRARPATGSDFGAFRRRHPIRPTDLPAAIEKASAIHLGPGRPETQIETALIARQAGLLVTLDPGFHAASLTTEDVDRMLQAVDAFLPSEVELASLCPGMGAAAAVETLRARSRAIIVAKLGAAGCLVAPVAGLPPVAVPACRVTARDPTGAGDAFCGGFLVGLARTDDPVLAACLGTVSASVAVESIGALAALSPDRDRIRARLAALLAIASPDHRADAFI